MNKTQFFYIILYHFFHLSIICHIPAIQMRKNIPILPLAFHSERWYNK